MKAFLPSIDRRKIWFSLLLLALTLPSRLINIDRAANIDEPFWVISGVNFYYAVTYRDFENTYFEYHPGVTNMWIISAAQFLYFPEYRGYGQGFFDTRKPNFEEFMRSHGREALVLLRISRYIQAGVLAVRLSFIKLGGGPVYSISFHCPCNHFPIFSRPLPPAQYGEHGLAICAGFFSWIVCLSK